MLPGQDTEEVSFTELFTSNVMLIGSPQHFFFTYVYECLDVHPSPSPELGLQVVVDYGNGSSPPRKYLLPSETELSSDFSNKLKMCL